MASEVQRKKPLDQIRAFNFASNEYLTKNSDRNLEELDKVLNVLTQINSSEVWDLSKGDVCTLIHNSAELLNQLDYKNNVTWSLVNLLTKVAELSSSKQWKKGYQLVPVLSRLLHSLPSTTHKKTIKLLELLQLLVEDFEVLSMETYMITLVKDLYNFISGDDPRTQFLAAFILSSILRKNFLALKIMMFHCPMEEFSTLRRGEDNQMSLLLETISFRLEQVDLSSPAPSSSGLLKILTKISTTLNQAFREENNLIFKFFTNFIRDISECVKWGSVLRELDPMDILTQILSIPQFDRNSPVLWEVYFGFLEALVSSISGDRLTIFNKVVKVVLSRLEVKPNYDVTNALSLLISALQGVVSEDLTAADRKNLKFQADQALPCLQTVYNSSAQDANRSECFCTCVRLYNLLATLELATSLQSESMMKMFKKAFSGCNKSELRSEMTVEFATLALTLSANSKGWTKLKNDLLANQEYLEAISAVIGSQDHSADTVKKAIAIINPNPDSFLQQRKLFPSVKETRPEPLQYSEPFITTEARDRVEESVNDLRLAASRLSLDEEERILPQVLEMQDFLGYRDQAQIRALRGDLAAADERLKNKTWIIENLSQELDQTKSLLRVFSARYSTSRRELKDIRSEHNSTSRNAEERITDLTSGLQETEKQLTSEKEITERLTGENEKMKSELELIVKERECLDQKLKEAKTAISKRDDKLKRMMKQLEEEQCKREDIEKKHEKLSKSHASLETLCRNQEEAFKKKEKHLEETLGELHELKTIRDAIFNLSKSGATSAGSG